MMKQVILLSKKPGMSAEAFKTYYETRHVPLAMNLVPRFAQYQRNFVLPGSTVEAAHIANVPPPPPFDVITEIWFEGPMFDQFSDDLKDPAIGDAIAKDEENLFDRSRMVVMVAEEHNTPASELGRGVSPPDGGSLVKMVCMIKRRPGMSRGDFIDYYETGHSRLAAKHLRTIAGYRRNYIIPGRTAHPAHIAHVPPPPDIDVMTEMWFRTKEDFDAMGTALTDPKIGAMFAEDEEKLFDRKSIQMFMVDERVTPKATLEAAARAKGY